MLQVTVHCGIYLAVQKMFIQTNPPQIYWLLEARPPRPNRLPDCQIYWLLESTSARAQLFAWLSDIMTARRTSTRAQPFAWLSDILTARRTSARAQPFAWLSDLLTARSTSARANRLPDCLSSHYKKFSCWFRCYACVTGEQLWLEPRAFHWPW